MFLVNVEVEHSPHFSLTAPSLLPKWLHPGSGLCPPGGLVATRRTTQIVSLLLLLLLFSTLVGQRGRLMQDVIAQSLHDQGVTAVTHTIPVHNWR